jgi:hypothetical protein
MLPSLATARDGESRCLGKSSLSDVISEMVTHAVEWGASDGVCYSKAVQNSHTSRHQSFAAQFLLRKMAALKEFHLQAASSK